MKILHVIPAIAPCYGGPSTVVKALCGALHSSGDIQVEVATTDAGGFNRRITRENVQSKFPVHLFAWSASERWIYSPQLSKWLHDQACNYDLVHIHALWSHATCAATRAAVKAGIPYVVRPAGMLSSYTLRRNAWSKWLYWQLVERHTIHDAAAFHVTSREEALDVHGLRSDAEVYVVPNGVDAAAFTMPRNLTKLRELCGPAAEDKPIVLFLSRLHPKKGIVDRLLPAIASMDIDCFVAIVGEEDVLVPGYRKQVRAMIDAYRLQDRVALLGAVTGDERWAMFDGADIFVLPSRSENFAVVVAEAMARGCPVAVTNTVQSSEHVIAAGAGEVVPDDTVALATALERMLRQPELRQQFSACAQSYAKQHFCWDRIAYQVCQMYRDCLTNDSPSRSVCLSAGNGQRPDQNGNWRRYSSASRDLTYR